MLFKVICSIRLIFENVYRNNDQNVNNVSDALKRRVPSNGLNVNSIKHDIIILLFYDIYNSGYKIL